MKKFLTFNVALAALLVVGSVVQAQEAVPSVDTDAPAVADSQSSVSDVVAPPVPGETDVVPTEVTPTVVGAPLVSDCNGCAQQTPYFAPTSYVAPVSTGCCGTAAYQAPVTTGCCGTVGQVAYQQPVVQTAGCCNDCGTIAQVAYQQPIVQSQPTSVVTTPTTSGIITPAAPVVSQGLQTATPVYSYAPTTTYPAATTSSCSGCGTTAATPVSYPTTTYPTETTYPSTGTYTPTTSYVGQSYTPTTSYAPTTGCNDCSGSTQSYSTGRVRTRLGGRLLRRN